MSHLEIFFTSIGMAVVSLVCRSFFLMPREDLPIPHWLREGLNYAPVAALAAVVAPEVLMSDGHVIQTWQDARVVGAVAGLLFFYWRPNLFGTIVCGTGVMLACRFGLGW